jgi:hypothetical protein
MMKDDNGTLSKMDLIQTISKCLKDNSECMFSSLRVPRGSHEHLDGEGLLESQQEELEVKIMPKLYAPVSLLLGNMSNAESELLIVSL